MSKRNPTWLDEYYLVVMKKTSPDIRRLLGQDQPPNVQLNILIHALNGSHTEMVAEREYPRTGDVVRTFSCYSPEAGLIRVTINFTQKKANCGIKYLAFVERVADGAQPIGKT